MWESVSASFLLCPKSCFLLSYGCEYIYITCEHIISSFGVNQKAYYDKIIFFGT